MGNKSFKEDTLISEKIVCYYPKNLDKIKYAYTEEVEVYDLDTHIINSNLEFWYPVIKDNIEMYFLDSLETYKKKNLYRIQDSWSKFKVFENIDKPSYIEIVDIKSKNDKSEDIYVLELQENFIKIKNSTIRDFVYNNYKIKIPQRYTKIFIYRPYVYEKEEKDLTELSNINDDLGITLDDIIPNEYPFYFLHSTNNFKSILDSKKICNYKECDVDFFDEKTGEYLYPTTNIENKWGVVPKPGIYMEYIDVDDILFQTLVTDDLFRPKTLKTSSEIYGEIGFIYPLEEIFKYHVNVKGTQFYGKGDKVDLNDFYSLATENEIIVRANSIEIDKASAVHVQFSSIELKFIYDYIPNNSDIKRNEIRIQDVISLYKDQRNNHWYIRKSNLIKVIDAYEENGFEIPPILCTKINYDTTSKIYNTIYDVDSDDEYLIRD